jgi:hypothetical protein
MKKIILCVLIVVFAINTFSQNNDTIQTISSFKRHSIYAELLGSSMFYSVNYDYLFRIYKDNIKLATGAGIGYFSYGYLSSDGEHLTIHYFYFTPEVNFLFGAKSHYFETGTALMTAITDSAVVVIAPSGRIGYRYQPQKGKFLFRIAYTPTFRTWGSLGYYWFGVSFGYIF